MKKEFKAGDKVLINGVVEYSGGVSGERPCYSLVVRISKEEQNPANYFTADGKFFLQDDEPQLMHAPEFEVGEEIEVRSLNSDDWPWNTAIFLYKISDVYYCVARSFGKKLGIAGLNVPVVSYRYARKIVKPVVRDEDVSKAIRVLEDAGRLKDGKILLG